ncbi:MAG: hypothetical protein QXZ59_06290, partial [Nitrososphaeria archaeon]
NMKIKIRNIYCPVCHRQIYFTGKVVYEGKRTKVIEWKCADCGVIIKSRHDKFGEVLTKERKWEFKPKPSNIGKKRKLQGFPIF